MANPRGQPKAEEFQSEHAHAITTLWSGRWISDEVDTSGMAEKNSRADLMVVEDEEKEELVHSDKQQNQPTIAMHTTKEPFPHAL